VAGVDFPVRLSGRRPGDSASVIADNTRIKSLLGWKPIHADLRAMIAQSLAWERRLHNRAA
jgi:UDP-glucose 4-epimerase